VGRNTAEGLAEFPDVRCPDDSATLVRLYLSYLSSLD